MTKGALGWQAPCLAACMVVGLLVLSPACGDTSDPTNDTGTSGSAGEPGTGASSGSGGTSSGAPSNGGNGQGATTSGGAPESGGPAGGDDSGPTPAAGSSSGGAGGDPVGGEGGGTGEAAECETDDDCVVIDDCCSCSSVSRASMPGQCEKLCIQSACAAQGLVGVSAVCRAKRCVFGLSCDRSLVTCKVAEPTCPAGKVPSVQGDCYGPCIPATECDAVTDCKDCAAGQACVLDQNFASFTRCVDVSGACATKPTCDCVNACEHSCTANDEGVSCFCPVC